MKTITFSAAFKHTRDGRTVLWIPGIDDALERGHQPKDRVIDCARDETWLVEHDTGRYFVDGIDDGRDLVNLWSDTP